MKYIIGLITFLFSASLYAAPADMTVSVWDSGCNHTMTTNHFILGPGETTFPAYVDFSQCSAEQFGNLLVFGYVTTKNRSRQLSDKNKVSFSLTCFDGNGNVDTSVSGLSALFVDRPGPSQGCQITATNNSKKDLQLRLRSQLIEE